MLIQNKMLIKRIYNRMLKKKKMNLIKIYKIKRKVNNKIS